MSPQVSVVVACHNAERWLSESLTSVLNEIDVDLELIVVDDGSTDTTAALAAEAADGDSRCRVLSKCHSGLADSLNFGIRESRGEWIARLDADDVSLPGRLLSQLEVSRNVGDSLALVGGGCIEIDEHAQTLQTHSYPSDDAELRFNLTHMRKFFPHSTAMYRRSAFDKVGGYRSRFTRSQDKDLWLRLGQVGTYGAVIHPVILLRTHPNQISHQSGGHDQVLMGHAAMLSYYLTTSGSPDPVELDEEQWLAFLDWLDQELHKWGAYRARKARSSAGVQARNQGGGFRRSLTLLLNLASSRDGLAYLRNSRLARYRMRVLTKRWTQINRL